MSKSILSKAENHLKKSDPKLCAVIELYGPCGLRLKNRDPFDVLISSIISQQLAAKTARAIKNRLISLCENNSNITHEKLSTLSVNKIQGIGISNKKAKWIKDIALACDKHQLSFKDIDIHSDKSIIENLTQYSGVGTWTAEMFLIFALGRLDVMSHHDFALKKAIKLVYQLDDYPSSKKIEEISYPWRPYRSVASWYLWRTLD